MHLAGKRCGVSGLPSIAALGYNLNRTRGQWGVTTKKTVPPPDAEVLSVGQVCARSGVAVSAIHYYEARGLIRSWRSPGNQRRYPREVLRRVAVIKVAQRLGIPLAAINDAFKALPDERSPTARDWARMSTRWRADLDDRLMKLTRLRDELSGCIGCGCLSLDSCPLYNRGDKLAKQGPGPRLLDRTGK